MNSNVGKLLCSDGRKCKLMNILLKDKMDPRLHVLPKFVPCAPNFMPYEVCK